MCQIGTPLRILQKAEVIAWRAWQIADDGALRSLMSDDTWPAVVPFYGGRVTLRNGEYRRGADGARRHPVGIHAWVKRSSLNFSSPVVIGQVKLLGPIVRHRDGYRGTAGVPVSLVDRGSKQDRARIRLAAAKYGLELIP